MTIQRCTHIFPDHHQCGPPALRGQLLCHFHHPDRKLSTSAHSRRRHEAFTLPIIRSREDIHRALNEILQRLAANRLAPNRASQLLYTLQLSRQLLP